MKPIRPGVLRCLGRIIPAAFVLFGLVWLTQQDQAAPSAAGPEPSRAVKHACSPTPEQKQAQQKLVQLVPDVRIDFDAALGLPHFVRSASGFLTGPNGIGRAVPVEKAHAFAPDDPHRAVKAFLDEHRALFGCGAEALQPALVESDYVNDHNGMRTSTWIQQVDGIPVDGAMLRANLTARGELITICSRFVPEVIPTVQARIPHRAALMAAPLCPAPKALDAALAAVTGQATLESAAALTPPQGVRHLHTLSSPSVLGDGRAQYAWFPVSRADIRLAWELIFTERSSNEMYRALVDAQTAEVLKWYSLTAWLMDKETSRRIAQARAAAGAAKPQPSAPPSPRRTPASAPPVTTSGGTQTITLNVYTSDSPSPFTPGWPTSQTGQPAVVPRTSVTFTALNPTASPNGWINDGVTETLGNNVDAHTDIDANDQPDLPRPTAANRVFDFPLDLGQSPAKYKNAAVTNLFYWCNFVHDKMYELGFTEPARNFQNDNFGRGGIGGDALQADAQDGSGTNNANFSSPPDGMAPRMQMFLWTNPNPDRDGDLDATIILHEYTHGLSNRLVGDGFGMSALQSGGLGEGWSDFYALALLSEAGDDVNGTYAVGSYAIYGIPKCEDNYYKGIRRYPYTPDMIKNPLTLIDIKSNPEVHQQGEVWCALLWEARVKMVTRYGFSGNQTFLQLVMDGMKLAPSNPSFVQARDAILLSDVVNNNGANLELLWEAFAKRGLGYSAKTPDANTTSNVVEAYDMPADLLAVWPASGLNSGGWRLGPFEPETKTFILGNIGMAPLNWTSSVTAAWVSVSPTGGTLAPGAAASLILQLTPVANALTDGFYTDTLTIVNTSTGSGSTTRPITLTVVKNYEIQTDTYNWIDPSSHTSLSLPDDGSVSQAMPFTFNFYDLNYSQIYISSNGFLGFSNVGMGAYINTDLPCDATPNNIICAYWDDLYPPRTGAIVKIGTVGSAPNRKLVVSWVNVPMISDGYIKETVTLQAILCEGSNDIVFQYNEVRPGIGGYGGGRSATVGVESYAGSVAKKYSYNGSPVLSNNLALRFTRNVPPPSVAFSAAAYTVGEAAGSATLTVQRAPTTPCRVAVNYATSDGTAAAGADYTAVAGTLLFEPGETSKTFSVPILNDALIEPDETVNLTLSNPLNATLGTPSAAVLTIVSDDVMIPVTLASGYNLIALPLAPAMSLSAEALAQQINADGGNCTSVISYDPVAGAFVTHPVGTAVNNFAIETGRGYFARCTKTSTWYARGCRFTAATAEIQLASGYNLISLPLEPSPPDKYTAERAGSEINAQPNGRATQIVRYDAPLGQFVTHPIGTAVENFTLSLGQGYFIRCTNGSTWRVTK